MKKLLSMLVVFCVVSSIHAQKQAKDFVINPVMYEQFTQAQIDHYLQTDLAELIRLNYKMTNYAGVSSKMVGGEYQVLGYPEQYAHDGVRVDEEEIIEKGYLNPFLYNFPQDEYKINVFPLHIEGYYVIVMPKVLYEPRVNAQLNEYGLQK